MFSASTRPSRIDPSHRIVRRQRRRRDVEIAVGRHREVKRGDAGRNGGERFGAALLIDPEDGAGAIADIQRSVGAERQSARHAEIRRHHLVAAVIEDAIDAALEAARHIQQAVGTDHHRRRIDEAVHERLARAARRDAEDRHGRFLPARAAVGDVEMAVGAEHRVVDLMQSGREQRADARIERRARQPRRP